MGTLTGRWKIIETDRKIGLHKDSQAKQSVFKVNASQTELLEIAQIDWGSARAWTLIPDNSADAPDGSMRAIILLRKRPHWVTFWRDDPGAETHEVAVHVTTVEADSEDAGRDTGTARGRN